MVLEFESTLSGPDLLCNFISQLRGDVVLKIMYFSYCVIAHREARIALVYFSLGMCIANIVTRCYKHVLLLVSSLFSCAGSLIIVLCVVAGCYEEKTR